MNDSSTAREGDLAQLVGLTHKHFIFSLKLGGELQTHRGVLKHDDLIGKPYGSQVYSHTGAPFFLLQPSIADILSDLEAGTGSGSVTIALATAVGAEGRVISYEQKPDTQNLARKNLERVGLASRVDFKLRDIREGFDETDADAFFLDVQYPQEYIEQVRAALKPGGFFGTIIPTFNQVEKTLIALKKHKFAFVEVCEVMLRHYKSDPARIRPTDRMVAHTGYLIFARRIEPSADPRGRELENEVSIEN